MSDYIIRNRIFSVSKTQPAWWGVKLEDRRARGERASAIAAKHKLQLTTTCRRAWYDDTWTETVVDWSAVADLLDKVAPGWDAAGVEGTDETKGGA